MAQNVYQINKQKINQINKSASEILGKPRHSFNLKTLLSNAVFSVILVSVSSKAPTRLCIYAFSSELSLIYFVTSNKNQGLLQC